MAGSKGRLIQHNQRCIAVNLIQEAVNAGARKKKACEILGISIRTYQRWIQEGKVKFDGRVDSIRPVPSHALTESEKQHVLDVLNSAEFASLPPSQVVPRLADKGIYLCSESTMYRVLHSGNQQHHRGKSKSPQKRSLTTHIATAPNQVWCWDITWLSGPAKGIWFYLYLMIDLFSRKIVCWEIHDEESADNASILLRQGCLRESIGNSPLILHSDNGSPIKGANMLETMYSLGVVSSFSRPLVRNDNAYAESIFRTCKYRPNYPSNGFGSIEKAREWVLRFTDWYNTKHRHSGIKFVTPQERHEGKDIAVLAKRAAIYAKAKEENPRRWTSEIRDWSRENIVLLNPEKRLVN